MTAFNPCFDVVRDEEVAGVYKLDLDRLPQRTARADANQLDRRGCAFTVEMRQIKGSGEITALEPISIFDPLRVKQRRTWHQASNARRTASGSRAITVRNARAGPVGTRRLLLPMFQGAFTQAEQARKLALPARCFSRIAFTSMSSGTWTSQPCPPPPSANASACFALSIIRSPAVILFFISAPLSFDTRWPCPTKLPLACAVLSQ